MTFPLLRHGSQWSRMQISVRSLLIDSKSQLGCLERMLPTETNYYLFARVNAIIFMTPTTPKTGWSVDGAIAKTHNPRWHVTSNAGDVHVTIDRTTGAFMS